MTVTSVPETVLAALDRLNGHARAWGCGKKAIYSYKKLATLVMAAAGEVDARSVMTEVRCDNCGGSGVWVDHWHDHKGAYVANHSNCRKCHRKGKVTLRFVETRFGDRRWHHPAMDVGHDVLRAAWGIVEWRWGNGDDPDIAILKDGSDRARIYEPIESGWEPKRPGEKLFGDEAATLLNVVEEWVKEVLTAGMESPWPKEQALQEMPRYSLTLPRQHRHGEHAICCLCGNERIVDHGIGQLRYRLDWALPCCADCSKRPVADWPKEPPPAEMLSPAIMTWLDRRGVDLTKPWVSTPTDAMALYG